MTKNKNKEKQA